VHSTCVLSGDSILIKGVAFVASKFPDFEEMCPEFGYEFLAPGSVGLDLGAFLISAALFLVVDDGLGDAALWKMLPSDRLLMSRLVMKWMVPWIGVGSGWLSEPLNDALGNEHVKWLSSVARIAEVVQGDGQELLLLCVSGWMGTAKEMLVFFFDSGAVGASVILLLVVAVVAVSCGKPAVDVLHKLLVLHGGLFLEHGVEQLPVDQLSSSFSPSAFGLEVLPAVVDSEHFMQVGIEG
jgi:hypothetical protein